MALPASESSARVSEMRNLTDPFAKDGFMIMDLCVPVKASHKAEWVQSGANNQNIDQSSNNQINNLPSQPNPDNNSSI